MKIKIPEDVTNRVLARLETASHLYKLLLRPASSFTLPRGVKWSYVEAPWNLHTRPDLPRSKNQYGVIEIDRRLTDEELEHFDIEEVR